MQFIRLTCDNVVLKTRKTQLRLLEFSTDSVLNNRKPMEGWRVGGSFTGSSARMKLKACAW